MILIAALLAAGCAGNEMPVAETPEYCLREGPTFDSERCARYLAWKTTSTSSDFPNLITASRNGTLDDEGSP